MVAGTQQPRSEEQEQLNEHPQPHPAPTAEEEALKRNTDCVYFLASPLTCKKGSECEYRHSEYARINPRDCYYWLNGSCLNPKCGFRHPPLDGLLGTQVAAPAGASVSSLHTPVPVATHAPYSSTAPYNPVAPSSSTKPAVPCIFFQKGYCLKGDRCAFLHGPVPTSNKVQQATAANPTTGPPSSKKIFSAPEKYAQQQNILPANFTKAVEVFHEPKPAPKVETVPPRNGMGAKRYNTSQTGLKEEVPRYKTSNFPPAVKGSTAYVSDEQGYHPAKDTDEHLRESSPGFDVLVDDELGDAEYYHGENQYGGQERRNGNEYNMGRSANYDSPADVDREMFRDTRGGYDSYDCMQGPYDWEQRRSSSERRGYSKAESPDRVEESDLRYRLSKHRRANGLRSVVNHDHASDNHLEERSHRSSSRRGSHQQESSLSSRLQGRIKLPGRSPVHDRDMEGSSRRPQISNSGRLRDRIKGRVEDEFSNREDRSIRDGPRKEIMDDSRPSFAGPRRLAELKTVDSKEHHVLRKRKALEDHQQFEGSLSFEGPMPLSEILKRKRQAKAEGPESSLNKEVKDQKITKESIIKKCSNTTALSVISPASNDEANRKEESKPVTAEVVEVEGKNEETQPPIVSDHEVEDGMIVEEEHVLEGEEQQGEDGEEYYYEQGDEGEYNYEDGENLGPEEEYLDDEDGDDFAKTIGVMSS